MANGEVCPFHTALAVSVGQHEVRLAEGDERMTKIERSAERIEGSVHGIQATLWRWGGALAVLLFLLSIFGPRISRAVFPEAPTASCGTTTGTHRIGEAGR